MSMVHAKLERFKDEIYGTARPNVQQMIDEVVSVILTVEEQSRHILPIKEVSLTLKTEIGTSGQVNAKVQLPILADRLGISGGLSDQNSHLVQFNFAPKLPDQEGTIRPPLSAPDEVVRWGAAIKQIKEGLRDANKSHLTPTGASAELNFEFHSDGKLSLIVSVEHTSLSTHTVKLSLDAAAGEPPLGAPG